MSHYTPPFGIIRYHISWNFDLDLCLSQLLKLTGLYLKQAFISIYFCLITVIDQTLDRSLASSISPLRLQRFVLNSNSALPGLQVKTKGPLFQNSSTRSAFHHTQSLPKLLQIEGQIYVADYIWVLDKYKYVTESESLYKQAGHSFMC